MTEVVQPDPKVLLKHFLHKPLPRSVEGIEARIRHWADVANNPSLYVADSTDKTTVKRKEKIAIQSLQRLLVAHPYIAAKLQREDLAQQAEAA